MDGNQKMYLWTMVIIAVVIVLAIAIAVGGDVIDNNNAFVNGYEKQTLQGTNVIQWVKVKDE